MGKHVTVTRVIDVTELGRAGGKATAANRTAAERSEAARKAVQARWAKKKVEVKTSPKRGPLQEQWETYWQGVLTDFGVPLDSFAAEVLRDALFDGAVITLMALLEKDEEQKSLGEIDDEIMAHLDSTELRKKAKP